MVRLRIVQHAGKAGTDPDSEIRDASGKRVGKARLHLAIQADADMQGSLYRTSQTLWR